MKKIICIVPYTYLPAKTGGQKCIASLYKTLSQSYSLGVIGTKANDIRNVKYKSYNIFSGSLLRYIDPLNYLRIKKIITEERADYLQIEHPYMGWMGYLLQKSTGVKLIVRSHNIEGLRFKNLNKWWWRILLHYEQWVCRQAQINYFITDDDKQQAIATFKLDASRCFTITYGIDQTAPLPVRERLMARNFLEQKHHLSPGDTIILFNGAFGYAPNINALNNVINHIFPLLKTSDKGFKLIVCGKDIPAEIVSGSKDRDIIFTGFVPDINVYLAGAHVFVNPVIEGGGIKTKLVEALALNLTCVSYKSGAIGIPAAICGDKLLVVEDGMTAHFADAIIKASGIDSDIPTAFYDQFSNNNILNKVKNILGT